MTQCVSQRLNGHMVLLGFDLSFMAIYSLSDVHLVVSFPCPDISQSFANCDGFH